MTEEEGFMPYNHSTIPVYRVRSEDDAGPSTAKSGKKKRRRRRQKRSKVEDDAPKFTSNVDVLPTIEEDVAQESAEADSSLNKIATKEATASGSSSTENAAIPLDYDRFTQLQAKSVQDSLARLPVVVAETEIYPSYKLNNAAEIREKGTSFGGNNKYMPEFSRADWPAIQKVVRESDWKRYHEGKFKDVEDYAVPPWAEYAPSDMEPFIRASQKEGPPSQYRRAAANGAYSKPLLDRYWNIPELPSESWRYTEQMAAAEMDHMLVETISLWRSKVGRSDRLSQRDSHELPVRPPVEYSDNDDDWIPVVDAILELIAMDDAEEDAKENAATGRVKNDNGGKSYSDEPQEKIRERMVACTDAFEEMFKGR